MNEPQVCNQFCEHGMVLKIFWSSLDGGWVNRQMLPAGTGGKLDPDE